MYAAVNRMGFAHTGSQVGPLMSVKPRCNSLGRNGVYFGVRNLSLAVAEPCCWVLVQDSISIGGSRWEFENESDK